MAFDPSIFTHIQNSVITEISNSFAMVIGYADNLLYFFAAFEIVLFGLFWALQGNGAWVRLLGSLLKIGLLIFIVDHFSEWLSIFLQSFAIVGGQVADVSQASHLLLAPGDIWSYGYNTGIALLKLSTTYNDNVGLAMLCLFMGGGILLVFGWLGIQLVLRVSAFYLLALISLLLMPVGVFRATSDFAFRAIRAVLQAGVGLLVLLIIMAFALPIFNDPAFTLDKNFNINQPLGIFFSGLVFTLMAVYLPAWVANAVGHIRTWLPEGGDNSTIGELSRDDGSLVSGLSDMRAAVQIDSSALSASTLMPASNVQVQLSSPISSASAMQGRSETRTARKLDSAAAIAQSISSETLRRLRSTARGSGV